MPPKITVLLVDDHALVRRGFRRMLEDDPQISVVGEASDGREAIDPGRQLIHRAGGARDVCKAKTQHGGIAEPEGQAGDEAQLRDVDR